MKLVDGIRPRGFFDRRGGDVDAWVLSRVPRRTVRAQGASSGSTILVFVVQITRGGAAGTPARSSAALPRAIRCQAYSLKSRVPVERRAGVAIAQPPANFCYPSGIKTNFAGGEIKAEDVNRTGGEVGRASASAVFLSSLLSCCSTALYAPALAERGAFREIPPTPLAHLHFPLRSPRSLRFPLLRLSRLPKPHSEPKEDPKIAHTTGHFGVTCFFLFKRTVSSPLNLEAAAFQPANSPCFRRSFNFHRSTKLAPDAC
jgi:hypothetical protein